MAELNRDQRDAFKAFKKKFKATQLEEDSRLCRGPLSTGKGRVVAIQPPTGFGRTVWEELTSLGYLTRDGSFYELVTWKKN